MEAADTLLRMGAYGDRFGTKPEGLSIARLREEFPHGARVADRVDAAASWTRVRTENGRVRLWHEVTDAELERLLAERAQEGADTLRTEEHKSELQSLMRNSHADFCLQ